MVGSWLWLSAEAREATISCVCYSCHEPSWMAWLRGSRASEGRLLQGSGTAGVSALSLCFRLKAQPGLSVASPEPGNLPSSPSWESQAPREPRKYTVPPGGLPAFVPASHTDCPGAGLGTLSEVKRPQVLVMHPVKKDQYITVLFLQKLKMSIWIYTGCKLRAQDH